MWSCTLPFVSKDSDYFKAFKCREKKKLSHTRSCVNIVGTSNENSMMLFSFQDGKMSREKTIAVD